MGRGRGVPVRTKRERASVQDGAPRPPASSLQSVTSQMLACAGAQQDPVWPEGPPSVGGSDSWRKDPRSRASGWSWGAAPLTSWGQLQACGSGDTRRSHSQSHPTVRAPSRHCLSTGLLGSRRGRTVSKTKVSGGGGASLLDPSGSRGRGEPGPRTGRGLRDGLSGAPSRSGGAASPWGPSLSGCGCAEPRAHRGWGRFAARHGRAGAGHAGMNRPRGLRFRRKPPKGTAR